MLCIKIFCLILADIVGTVCFDLPCSCHLIFILFLASQTWHCKRCARWTFGKELAPTGSQTGFEWSEAGVHLQTPSHRTRWDGSGVAEGMDEDARSLCWRPHQSPASLWLKSDCRCTREQNIRWCKLQIRWGKLERLNVVLLFYRLPACNRV